MVIAHSIFKVKEEQNEYKSLYVNGKLYFLHGETYPSQRHIGEHIFYIIPKRGEYPRFTRVVTFQKEKKKRKYFKYV